MKTVDPIVYIKVGLAVFYMALLSIVALSQESILPLFFIAIIPLVLDKIDAVEYVEEIVKPENQKDDQGNSDNK